MNRQNWDDLRFVLSVADTGSVSETSRQFGVTHATVLRRIAAFESRHGAPVFLRSARGYSVLPDKLPALDAAIEVENAMLAVERLLTGSVEALKGPVRITSTDSLCQTVLPALISDISAAYPDLKLSLHSANRHLDFNRMAADITVRPALQLEETLIGKVAGNMVLSVYHSAKTGPASDDNWLSLEGPLARSKPGQWMASHLRRSKFSTGSDSFMVQKRLVEAGMGQSYLPQIVVGDDANLVRAQGEAEDLTVPVWVASAADMAHTPKVKLVSKMLVEGLKAVLD